VLPADLFQTGGTDSEDFAGLVDRQMEVLRQHLHADVTLLLRLARMHAGRIGLDYHPSLPVQKLGRGSLLRLTRETTPPKPAAEGKKRGS
jgi:hypothetical protein